MKNKYAWPLFNPYSVVVKPLCNWPFHLPHQCKLHEKVFPGSLNEEHPVLIRATHGGRVKNSSRIRDERPPSALSGAPHVLGMDTEAASTSLYGIWAESHFEKERKSIRFCLVCLNSGDLFRVQVGNVLSPWCCDQECRWCSIKLIATYNTQQLLPAYHYNPPRYHGNQLFPSCERLVEAFREDGRAPVAGSPTLPGERSHFNFCITLPLRIADKSRLITRLWAVFSQSSAAYKLWHF